MRRHLLLTALIVVVAGALCPHRAHGYAEEIHTFIASAALKKSGLDQKAAPIPPATAAAIRAAIDAFARSDAALQREWTRRYPTPAAFDAWAEKELLLLAPTAQVFGIDRPSLKDGAGTLLDLLVQGTREPDDDYRNRERLGYDAERQPLRDRRGQPVPADPALLNMGKLGALSSQAHAHYGLAQVEFSEDPEVLKREPRRFAVASSYKKGPILTLAAEMAQEHLDLALLAALLAEGASPELAWLHTGQGFHYLQDVGNQIHTVQVGLYDFFFDAFMERLKLAFLTGGGYLGELRSLASIGIDILTNHHVLSENYTQKRVKEALQGGGAPEARRLSAAPAEDDPEFAARLDQALRALGDRPEQGEFALAITRALIDVSSLEGADVYRATRALAVPRLRKAGVLYGEKEDPDPYMAPRGPENDTTYQQFFALQERAFRRCGTAMRRWVALQQQALLAAQDEKQREELRRAVQSRLVRRQLAALSAAEARRADYLKNPPAEASGPERMPAVLLVEIAALGLLGLGAWLLLRRRRRAAP
jgi:hypothetical protein